MDSRKVLLLTASGILLAMGGITCVYYYTTYVQNRQRTMKQFIIVTPKVLPPINEEDIPVFDEPLNVDTTIIH